MMGDPKTMSIYEKILEVRKSVPYLKKETKGFNCKYVKGSQVLGAVREKLDELGLLLKPEIISTTHQEVKFSITKLRDGTEHQEEKTETLVKIEMLFTWYNVHKPEEKIECRWASMGQNERDKAIGAAMTYAERYFLLKFFMIATDELDPDAYKEKYAQGEENEADTSQPQKILSIDDKIPDAILPQELRGRGITFLELGKNVSAFTFATKTAGPQNGLYLLKYWANTTQHPAHSPANQILDVLSQATSPAEGPTTPQQ